MSLEQVILSGLLTIQGIARCSPLSLEAKLIQENLSPSSKNRGKRVYSHNKGKCVFLPILHGSQIEEHKEKTMKEESGYLACGMLQEENKVTSIYSF